MRAFPRRLPPITLRRPFSTSPSPPLIPSNSPSPPPLRPQADPKISQSHRLGHAENPSPSSEAKLKAEEIAKINILIPNLCNSGHLREAIALLDASLLAGAPLQALPIAALLRRLAAAAEPDMTHSMALLTALLHNPRRPSAAIAAVGSMMVDIYLENGLPGNALKVFDHMRRPNSLCRIEAGLCGKLVRGLCQHGRLLEAMKVVREMVRGCGGVEEVRESVYGGLLHDARVREGMEVDAVLRGVGEGGEEACGRALVVIDRIIMNWRD